MSFVERTNLLQASLDRRTVRQNCACAEGNECITLAAECNWRLQTGDFLDVGHPQIKCACVTRNAKTLCVPLANSVTKQRSRKIKIIGRAKPDRFVY